MMHVYWEGDTLYYSTIKWNDVSKRNVKAAEKEKDICHDIRVERKACIIQSHLNLWAIDKNWWSNSRYFNNTRCQQLLALDFFGFIQKSLYILR